MDADPRIRYVRLAENSGGCSVPRNRGIEAAAGTWVMFCDSDDRYERHAAKNLLLAVEGSGSDLGCGVAERVDVRSGEGRRWREDVHERGAVASIEDRPELIADTVSVNKIYRRQWLLDANLRFPEGLLYEDQLFTMQAYCEASSIAVISETVYYWSVDRVAEELSITQRRHEERNARDRMEINRRIDQYLSRHGSPGVQAAKARKFLSHDLYLYLSSLMETDEETSRSLMDILVGYVRTVDLRQAAGIRPALRVAIYHLLLGDLEGLRQAMRFIRWSAVLEVPVIAQRDRQVWDCEHRETGPSIQGLEPDWWLDMTDMAIVGAPVPSMRMCHRLMSVQSSNSVFKVQGHTVDAFRALGRSTRVELVLMSASGRVWCAIPGTGKLVDALPGAAEGCPGRFEWQAEGRWEWRVDPAVDLGTRGTVALQVAIDGQLNSMPVRMPAGEVPKLAARLGHGVVARLAPGDFGVIEWVARPATGHDSAVTWHVRRQGSGLVAGGLRVAHRRLLTLTDWLAVRLPPARMAIFESMSGRAFDGHPRAISEVMARESPEIRQAWSLAVEEERFPPWAARLRRDTVRHRWMVARARWWVDDSGMMQAIRKHPRNRSLQTWRGMPIASVGNARHDWPLLSRSQRRSAAAGRWDLLLSPSAHFTESVPRQVGFRGDLIPSTTPFGDAVERSAQDPALRGRLALPADRPVILFAMSHRDLPFDLSAVTAAVGRRAYLLLASDDGQRVSIPGASRFSARDVTNIDGRADHLAAADLMVTDFSIWTLDFARLQRPFVYWKPGFDRMRRESGAAIDLGECGPGPMVATTATLIAALEDFLDRGMLAGPGSPERSTALAAAAGAADGHGADRALVALITGRSLPRHEAWLPLGSGESTRPGAFEPGMRA
jgi:CDP-glycerol glycerophosphotransferase